MSNEAAALIPADNDEWFKDPRIHLVLACDFDTYAKYRMWKKLPGTRCQRLMMEHQIINYHNPINAKIILVQPGYKDNRIWKDGGIGRWVKRANEMKVPWECTEEFYFPVQGGLILT